MWPARLTFFVLCTSAASAAQLSVRLSVLETLASLSEFKVVATLKNNSPAPLKLVNTPDSLLSQAPTDSFLIAKPEDGTSPVFAGISARALPAEKIVELNETESFTVIEAGAEVEVEHDLSTMYNFTLSGAGVYTLQPASKFFFSVVDNALSEVEAEILQSSFTIAEEITQLAITRKEAGFTKRATYAGCSSSERSALTYVALAATDLSNKANQSISSTFVPTTQYTTWFGSYSEARYNTVLSHYNAISNSNYSDWHYDCASCNVAHTYSFVYPDDFGRIFLCRLFWDLPLTGFDSMAGTLVNEASRFSRNGGTDDYAVGRSNSRTLARNSPHLAIFNADSHEYFAEDL